MLKLAIQHCHNHIKEDIGKPAVVPNNNNYNPRQCRLTQYKQLRVHNETLRTINGKTGPPFLSVRVAGFACRHEGNATIKLKIG